MTRKMPSMVLAAALAATVAGCDGDPGEKVVQRDVYTGEHAFENCVADWGNEELCKQQLDDAEKKAAAAATASNGSSAAHTVFIWGPGYSGSDRSVVRNGQTYTPAATRAAQTAAFSKVGSGVHATTFAAPRAATSSVSRGGFGGAGHSMGGGGA